MGVTTYLVRVLLFLTVCVLKKAISSPAIRKRFAIRHIYFAEASSMAEPFYQDWSDPNPLEGANLFKGLLCY